MSSPTISRVSRLYAGYSIPPYYDSLAGKLIVHGRDRTECIARLKRSLGEMVVGGVTLDLGKVHIPIYNLATREDHIAPARSVFLGSSSFGSAVTFVLAGSGHIAGVINPPLKKKRSHWIGRGAALPAT